MKFGGSQSLRPADRAEVPSGLLASARHLSRRDRPWAIKPPADPDVPDDIIQKIDALLAHEQQMVMQTTGQQPPEDAARKRIGVDPVGTGSSEEESGSSRPRYRRSGLKSFWVRGCSTMRWLSSLSICRYFRSQCIKGPMVKIVPEIKWPPGGGQPTVASTEDVLGAGVAVRHLVDARCSGHRQCQCDREVHG